MADQPSYRVRPGYFDPGGAANMHASLRASDTDREQLVDVLKSAFSEGRLDQDEYTARMERAYTAKTYGELRALVGDLPGPLPQVPYSFTQFQPKPTNGMAVASMVFGIATPLFGLTAIPAVILGHKARSPIRRTVITCGGAASRRELPRGHGPAQPGGKGPPAICGVNYLCSKSCISLQ